MKKTSFYPAKIKVINGISQLIITGRERFNEEIKKFKDDEEVYLYVSSNPPKRSVQHNNFYWGFYLPSISEQTGHTPVELHAYFKKKFLSHLFQVSQVMGERVNIEPTTTELTTKEFTQFLREIEAETGIPIPEL